VYTKSNVDLHDWTTLNKLRQNEGWS